MSKVKKFKGLVVPEMRETPVKQNAYCQMANCEKLICNECIFCMINSDKFKMWQEAK